MIVRAERALDTPALAGVRPVDLAKNAPARRSCTWWQRPGHWATWPVPEVQTARLGACQMPAGVSSPFPCSCAFYGAAACNGTDNEPNAGGGTRRFEAAS